MSNSCCPLLALPWIRDERKALNTLLPKEALLLEVKTVKEDGDNEELLPFIPEYPDYPNASPSQIPEQEMVDATGKPIPRTDHLHEMYINMEVKLKKNDKDFYGKVIGLCFDKNGNPIGQAHENPILNTLMYGQWRAVILACVLTQLSFKMVRLRLMRLTSWLRTCGGRGTTKVSMRTRYT